MKRYRDTNMWDEDWYIDLSNEHKFFWQYVLDTCNHAGIWKPNLKKFEFVTGWKINIESFMSEINQYKERIIHLSNGKYWVLDFVAFQQGKRLGIKNNCHRGILKELAANGIHTQNVRGLISVNLEGITEEQKQLITPINLELSCGQVEANEGSRRPNSNSTSNSISTDNGKSNEMLDIEALWEEHVNDKVVQDILGRDSNSEIELNRKIAILKHCDFLQEDFCPF